MVHATWYSFRTYCTRSRMTPFKTGVHVQMNETCIELASRVTSALGAGYCTLQALDPGSTLTEQCVAPTSDRQPHAPSPPRVFDIVRTMRGLLQHQGALNPLDCRPHHCQYRIGPRHLPLALPLPLAGCWPWCRRGSAGVWPSSPRQGAPPAIAWRPQTWGLARTPCHTWMYIREGGGWAACCWGWVEGRGRM